MELCPLLLNGNEQYTVVLRCLSAYCLSTHRDALLPVIAEHVSYFQSNIDPQVKYNNIVLTSLTLGAWGEYYHMHALAVLLNVPIFQYCTFRHETNMCLLDSSLSPSGLVEAFRRSEHFTRGHLLFCSSEQKQELDSGDLVGFPRPSICIFYITITHYVALMYVRSDSHELIPIPDTRLVQD